MSIQPSVKIYFLSLCALAWGMWELGFQLGVYGELFFQYILGVWFVTLAFTLGFLFLPRHLRPFGRWTLIPLLIPTFWLITEVLKLYSEDGRILQAIADILGLLTLLICLPYIVYLLLQITHSETLTLRPKRLLYSIVGISVGIFFLAYLLGVYHPAFLSCHDFMVSGQFVPSNCWKP